MRRGEPRPDPLGPLIGALHEEGRPRVWSLVVTVFGDAVAPRGGRIATAQLAELMERIGVGQGALRTALSRLVAEGTLERDRRGRASFHRLSAAAAREVEAASRVIYAPPTDAGDWTLGMGPAPRRALALANGAWLAREPPPEGAVAVRGALIGAGAVEPSPAHAEALRRLARDLDALAAIGAPASAGAPAAGGAPASAGAARLDGPDAARVEQWGEGEPGAAGESGRSGGDASVGDGGGGGSRPAGQGPAGGPSQIDAQADAPGRASARASSGVGGEPDAGAERFGAGGSGLADDGATDPPASAFASPLGPSARASAPCGLGPLDAMAARTLLIHRWRRLALRWPDLPDPGSAPASAGVSAPANTSADASAPASVAVSARAGGPAGVGTWADAGGPVDFGASARERDPPRGRGPAGVGGPSADPGPAAAGGPTAAGVPAAAGGPADACGGAQARAEGSEGVASIAGHGARARVAAAYAALLPPSEAWLDAASPTGDGSPARGARPTEGSPEEGPAVERVRDRFG